MTEEENKTCVICLEELDNNTEIVELSNKYGCGCKQIVHQDCLTIWIIRKAKNTRKNSSSCIMCRQEVELGKIKRNELSQYVLSNVIIDDNENEINNEGIVDITREPYTLRDVIRMSIGGTIMFGIITIMALGLLGVFN